MSSGGAAPASAIASRNTPTSRVRSGRSQVVSERCRPGPRIRTNSVIDRSGRPRCGTTKLLMAASNEPSSKGSASAPHSAKIQAGVTLAGKPDHRGCEVHADDGCAAPGGCGGRIAGAGRDVEHARPGPNWRSTTICSPGVTSALVVPAEMLYDQLRSPAVRKKNGVGKGVPRPFTIG